MSLDPAESPDVRIARLDERLKCLEDDVSLLRQFERDYRNSHSMLEGRVGAAEQRVTALESSGTGARRMLTWVEPVLLVLAGALLGHWVK